MGIVYQLTFFLALGLLAIVITIFVFAVSQVGRATESASKEQQDILLKQKEAKGRLLEKIQGQLEEARKAGYLDEAKLLNELQNTKGEIAGYDTELRHLQERIMLIRRKGAVVWPGAFFLATLVLTITASGLAESENLVALSLWIISIGTLAFGGFRVFRTLGAIEKVTITSQEAIEKLPEAVKAALVAFEEEKKPELQLRLEGEEFPLQVETDSEVELTLMLNMLKGDSAEDVSVHFAVPPSFVFPHEKNTVILTPESHYPDYIDIIWQKDKVIRGLVYRKRVTIKTPPTAGRFNLVYWIFCRGFWTQPTELHIIVE